MELATGPRPVFPAHIYTYTIGDGMHRTHGMQHAMHSAQVLQHVTERYEM